MSGAAGGTRIPRSAVDQTVKDFIRISYRKSQDLNQLKFPDHTTNLLNRILVILT